MRLVCPLCWSDIDQVVATASGKVRCPSCHALVEPARGVDPDEPALEWADETGDEAAPTPSAVVTAEPAAAEGADKPRKKPKRRYRQVRPSGLLTLIAAAYLCLGLLLVVLLAALERVAGLLGGLLLLLGLGLLWVGHGLPRWRFAAAQPLEGKTKDQVVQALGEPTGYQEVGDGLYLLEWSSPGCQVVLAFRGNRCEGVRRLSFA